MAETVQDTQSDLSKKRQLSIFEQMPLCRELGLLFTNSIYMTSMLAMVTLQFAAAGLQFWTISYL